MHESNSVGSDAPALTTNANAEASVVTSSAPRATKERSVKRFVKNVGSGWLAMLVGGLVGMATLPMSMEYLDKELYSISALVTTFLSIFNFLSFGLPPTLLRFFSLAFAEEDTARAHRILSTSVILLGSVGMFGALVFIAVYPIFLRFYSIPEYCHADLWILYLVTAFHFFQTFTLVPYYALVQARRRYDLTNFRRIFASLLRLVVLWLGFHIMGKTLLVLAVSSICSVVYELCSILLIAYRLEGRRIIPIPRLFTKSLLKEMFSFSIYSLINSIFMPLLISVPVLIIGRTLGKPSVAEFTPAVTICNLCASILAAFASPLTPLASADKKRTGGANLGRWVTIIGEAVAFLGFMLFVGVGVMGRDFIYLWLGPGFVTTTAPTLMVLLFGVVCAHIQAVNYYLALGSSTIKPHAFSAMATSLTAIVLVFCGTRYFHWSVVQVAICISMCQVVRNACFLPYYYSGLFNYDFFDFTWRAYRRPILIVIAVLLVCYFVRSLLPSYHPTVVRLVLGSAAVAVFYSIVGWRFMVGQEVKERLPLVHKAPKFVQKILLGK
ncbi:MAG: oligosaccharide flippase family protein [Planctomycetia bacterium]|nr:oligosaccharide flippase family protein [Planctomycetia bacterium]